MQLLSGGKRTFACLIYSGLTARTFLVFTEDVLTCDKQCTQIQHRISTQVCGNLASKYNT